MTNADREEAKRCAEDLKTQLDALEARFQRLAVENVETLRAEARVEARRLLEALLEKYGLTRRSSP